MGDELWFVLAGEGSDRVRSTHVLNHRADPIRISNIGVISRGAEPYKGSGDIVYGVVDTGETRTGVPLGRTTYAGVKDGQPFVKINVPSEKEDTGTVASYAAKMGLNFSRVTSLQALETVL